ncbi:hypothetical protein [Massilia agri]|uniref:Uncharacterized protein n=1 Tax=Massilia agri TaxID=1886785 RepID=A0ABT2AGV2_9BURK|nr:hypothetical protein [Massilia agri]MCS0595462.1 hypothetical protein [Massilia agri]
MRQYKMTGSEKADGYSRDAFVGLDEYEKKTVFELLVKELPWSAEWLFYLDPEKALAVTKQIEEQSRGNPYAHVYKLQEQIVKYSGDLNYQKRMIDDFPNYIDRLKPRVVDAINRTPTTDVKLDFFKQVILLEANSDAVARASQHLLDSLNISCEGEREEEYNRLIRALRSDNLTDKKRAIAELRRYGSII